MCYLMMIVHGITMPSIKSYEIHLQIDGVDSIIALDDTYPEYVYETPMRLQ